MAAQRVALMIAGSESPDANTRQRVGPPGGKEPGPRRLVLVHPPQQGLLEGFSSGLVALANHAAAKLPSVPVTLLDLGLADEAAVAREVAKVIAAGHGQLFVGITTTTASYRSALRVAKAFKCLDQQCMVIMGGHHASSQDDVILDHHTRLVDFVVRGEGEIALVELLRQFPCVQDVPNLTYRQGMTIARTDVKSPLLDTPELDLLAPTYNGWGLRSAPGKFDHTTYVSARGCPLRCAFCAVSGDKTRSKSIPAVIADLRLLVGQMGYRQIAIEDNFFAQSPRRTIDLCRAIEELQRDIPFRWDCQTRVESCREDVLEAMERAGCEAIYLGVESFDPEQLLYLRKTNHPGDYMRKLSGSVVPWLLRSRIDCYLNLQLGLPGEEKCHRANTLRALSELGRRAADAGEQITIFPQLHVIYPGTRHFEEAVMEGRFGRLGREAFEEFTRWEEDQQPILDWLGEHFAHGTGGIPEGIICRDLLRSQGRFDINPSAVMEVVNYLNAIANIEGIRVFRYGRYLARVDETDANKAKPKGVPL